MLQQYGAPIFVSLGASVLAALFMAIPYAIYNYRKHGVVPMKKTMVWYSFLWYLVAAYSLVVLPLPSREAVSEMTTPYYNLEPFIFIEHFLLNSGIDWTDPATYFSAFTHPTAYTVYFNVIMMIPLGIYLRRYFYFGFFRTVASGFLLSLFFELTQLSGLYGIYPRPYRLFNVDDLMMNTVGAAIGFLSVPVIRRVLPTIEEKMGATGIERVTSMRRIIAFFLDLTCLGILSLIASGLFSEIPVLGELILKHGSVAVFLFAVLFFSLTSWIGRGRTIGMAIVKIRISHVQGQKAGLFQLVLRHLVFFIWFRGLWIIIEYLPATQGMELAANFGVLVIVMLGYMHIAYCLVMKKDRMFHELITKTALVPISTRRWRGLTGEEK